MQTLHTSAMENDLESIRYLLNTGHDVNAREVLSGYTALHSALHFNHFEVVKIFLDNNVDITINDSHDQTPLGILMTKDTYTVYKYAPFFIQNLKERNLETETKASVLLKAGCSFDLVVSMNDVEVSKIFLKSKHSLSKHELKVSMFIAMSQLDIGNVELILRHDSRDKDVRETFYNRLLVLLRSRGVESVKLFIERLIDWKVIDNNTAIVKLDFAFRVASKEVIQVFFKSKIVEYARQNFGVDLRASIFGNRNVNAMEILKNHKDFDVNAKSVDERTALHWAVRRDLIENVKFLLDAGADVECKTKDGRTVLFDCVDLNDVKMAELLFAYNADVRVVDKNGQTLLEFAEEKKSSVLELITERLVSLQDLDDDFSGFDQSYKSYSEEFETMQTGLILRTCRYILFFLRKWKKSLDMKISTETLCLCLRDINIDST